MDAVQFGRWLGERRHACGWPSQRALVEAAHRDPLLGAGDLSEAFLARLEAGHLAHPFRGLVRRRVLVLAWLLCKTPAEVRAYLRAAGLVELGPDEAAQIERLIGRLSTARGTAPAVLPPRPARLIGREAVLGEVLHALVSTPGGVYAITGMPGVGKSALAREALHALATDDHLRAFPDGVAAFTATGWRGAAGLAALLDEVGAVFGAAPGSSRPTRLVGGQGPSQTPPAVGSSPPRQSPAPAASRHAVRPAPQAAGEGAPPRGRREEDTPQEPPWVDEPASASVAPVADDLDMPHGARAGALARVHLALTDKRVLLLLDDLDPAFPLREALEVLLVRRGGAVRDGRGEGRCTVLLTSRYLPAPALVSSHLHLAPLAPPAALVLFTALVGRALDDAEREYAEMVCAALGGLPLAIETAAMAVAAYGISLPLLAARVTAQPLDELLDAEGEVRATLVRALGTLQPRVQERFTLLGALGAQIFSLESAAVIRLDQVGADDAESTGSAVIALRPSGEEATGGEAVDAVDDTPTGVSREALVDAAAELGVLVRHSLLEAMPGEPGTAARQPDWAARERQAAVARYRLHPLLRAYAAERLDTLDPASARTARRSVQRYALAYVERHQGDLAALDRERDLLLAALGRSWKEREYPAVIHLVAGLWPVTSCLGCYELSARVLDRGISASQRLQDRYHLARFLNRLGMLLYYHGEPARARAMWETSLEIAEALRQPVELWQPLANLAMLACAEGDYTSAQRFAESYLRRGKETDSLSTIAGALFNRALFAQRQGDVDRAHADLSACTRLLVLRDAANRPLLDGVLEMAAQAELARVQGDYTRARHHSELAVTLAEESCDHFLVADLLLDQARFAHLQQRQEEARALAERVVEVATRVEAHRLRAEGLALLRQLPASS